MQLLSQSFLSGSCGVVLQLRGINDSDGGGSATDGRRRVRLDVA